MCKGTWRAAPPPAGAAAYCGFANPSSARIPSDVSGSQRLTLRRRSANAATPISSTAPIANARGASVGAGETPEHVPRCPGRSHRPKVGLQAVLQQTPFAQLPVAHSAGVEHAPPWGMPVLVGVAVGVLVGVSVTVGVLVGVFVGVFVGVLVGVSVTVGVLVGVFVGVMVGVCVGVFATAIAGHPLGSKPIINAPVVGS